MNTLDRFLVGRFLVFLGCALALLSWVSCEDEKCGNPKRSNYIYEFKAPVSIKPAQAIYSVGDTVSIEVDIPKKITDLRHNEIETILSENILHASWVRKVDGEFSERDAIRYVEYLLWDSARGEFEIQERNLIGTFGMGTTNDLVASLSYQIILKQPGVFWFTFGGNAADEEEDAPFLELANVCSNGVIQLLYEVNNGADNNFSILCETEEVFCTPAYAESNRGPAFDDRAGYVFKVVE